MRKMAAIFIAMALAMLPVAAQVGAYAIAGTHGRVTSTHRLTGLGTYAASLSAVGFVTPAIGWLGGKGVILGTTDGGQHWRVQWRGSGQVQQIQFLSARDTFALVRGAVLVTRDGGRTWARLKGPSRAAGCRTLCLFSMSWLTTRVGYGVVAPAKAGALTYSAFGTAFGIPVPNGPGVLYKTADGGKTWRRVVTPHPVQSVCSIRARNVFASFGPRVYGTTNGGDSWRLVYTAPLRPMGVEPYAGLACGGSTVALQIVVEDAAMEHIPYVAFVSTDAGRRWHVSMEENYTHPATKGVNAPEGPGTEPGAFTVTPGGAPVYGGWVPWTGGAGISLARPGGLTQHAVPGAEQIAAMSFPTLAAGYVVAAGIGGGRLYGTRDGGRTWRQYYPVGQSPLYAIAFPTASIGFGLGMAGDPSAILRTTNAGRSWRKIAQLPLWPNLYGGALLAFANTRDGVVALGGRDFVTRNGGRTWTGTGLDGATRVAFDATAGCATGSPVGALITKNAGRTWTHDNKMRLPLWASPTACAVVAADPHWRQLVDALGYSLVGAVGGRVAWFVTGNDLYRTNDGGATWTVFRSLAGDSVLDAAFPTATVGYLLNSQGVLFRTNDGGGQWRALPWVAGNEA